MISVEATSAIGKEGSSKIEESARSPCLGGWSLRTGLRLRKSGERGSRNLLGSFFVPRRRPRNVRRWTCEGWRNGRKAIVGEGLLKETAR